jgi:hypothetical protein
VKLYNKWLRGKNMVYCSKCGTKNEDDAEFCKKCGDSLTVIKKRSDERCEEECAGGKHGTPIFWGILIILIGLLIIFEGVLKNIKGLPSELSWIYTTEFGLIFAIFIALAFIFLGIRIITKR